MVDTLYKLYTPSNKDCSGVVFKFFKFLNFFKFFLFEHDQSQQHLIIVDIATLFVPIFCYNRRNRVQSSILVPYAYLFLLPHFFCRYVNKKENN
jgi:hypothetical protein